VGSRAEVQSRKSHSSSVPSVDEVDNNA
jgi:hypothetical protein